MPKAPLREIWIHALGAKVGGGLTYLNAIVPILIKHLEGKGVRIVLLLPTTWQGPPLPEWFEVRVLQRASKSRFRRLIFDNWTLPRLLRNRPNAALFCSGSFSPLWKSVPTVTLLRNALYFDVDFQHRERLAQRINLTLQRVLIAQGAQGCRAVLYPSEFMRNLVESWYPSLRPRGIVSYYGISDRFRQFGPASAPSAGNHPLTFLYVMTYTLQKNLGYILRALALAKQAGFPVRVIVTSNLARGPKTSHQTDKELIEKNDLIGSGYLAPVGTKHGDDLLNLYKEVDACVFPSICESFGHPLVEAMALGKPIICADRPYAREICGPHAVYIDPEKPEELLRVWQSWPQAARNLLPIDRVRLFEQFSWSKHVSCLIESLLGPQPTPAESDGGQGGESLKATTHSGIPI